MDKPSNSSGYSTDRGQNTDANQDIEAGLLILNRSGRHAAAKYLQEKGIPFRTTVRVLAEPLRRRTTSRT